MQNKKYHKIQSSNSKPKRKNKVLCWLAIFLLFFLVVFSVAYIYFSQNLFKQRKVTTVVPEQHETKSGTDLTFPETKLNVHKSKGEKEQRQETKKRLPTLSKGFFGIDKALRNATSKTDSKVYGGEPVYRGKNDKLTVLRNIAYVCGYSEKRKCPLWVAYRYDKNNSKNTNKRPSHFRPDMRTKSRIKPNDYSRSGYDKGHMAPNSGIALRYGTMAQEETFLMSNIVPQTPALNRKVWSKLERYESMLANSHDKVWIITGPVFGNNKKFLKNGIEVPEAFYKIIVDEDKDKMRILPFLIPQNVTGKEHMRQFITSVDEIEAKTGLDFFAPMNDIEQRNMEKMVPTDVWR